MFILSSAVRFQLLNNNLTEIKLEQSQSKFFIEEFYPLFCTHIESVMQFSFKEDAFSFYTYGLCVKQFLSNNLFFDIIGLLSSKTEMGAKKIGKTPFFKFIITFLSKRVFSLKK